MCAVCETCARSASSLRSKTSVTSTQRSGVPPLAITQTSGTLHASSPSAASSRCANGLRASG